MTFTDFYKHLQKLGLKYADRQEDHTHSSILGSTIQDWAVASPLLRRSSGLINIGSGLLLAALAPSSGYLASVPDGVAMALATPTRPAPAKTVTTTRK